MENVNLSMYNYFLSLNVPFRCGRISMWPEKNKYINIPNFKFKFMEKKYADLNYSNLNDVISKFNGVFKWELVANPKGTNFIIKPKINIEDLIDINLRKEIIDMAILDIIPLVNYLKHNYKIVF